MDNYRTLTLESTQVVTEAPPYSCQLHIGSASNKMYYPKCVKNEDKLKRKHYCEMIYTIIKETKICPECNKTQDYSHIKEIKSKGTTSKTINLYIKNQVFETCPNLVQSDKDKKIVENITNLGLN
ncbi:MAG: hypothetical protein Tsb0021_11240 [Chlamydiales bacterium]